LKAIKTLSALIGFGAVAELCLQERSRLKIVRLIKENPIPRIRTTVISDLSPESKQPENSKNTEVIIPYFSILLGEKVIKLNQDVIRIRAVEIGGDFVFLSTIRTVRKNGHRIPGYCAHQSNRQIWIR
jgi:hypothetical protein